MLERLSIENLAVIEKAEAAFSPGLNVITGETGAGKSVFAGAIALALGARAEIASVRDGAKEARVEAVFCPGAASRPAVDAVLDAAGIEKGDTLVVRRTLGAQSGGRVWINDSPSTVATLRKLGAAMADFHGPQAAQRLREESYRRSAIDAFGGIDSSAYAKAWLAMRAAEDAVAALEAAGPVEDEIDLLKYQISEFDAAELTQEDADIAERHAAMAHAEEIVETAGAVTEALGGDGGAADVISRLAPSFAAMSKHLPAAAEWAAQAESLAIGIQELSRTIADAASAVDADEETFAALDERLGVVNKLKRKYLKNGGGVEELIDLANRKRERLEELEGRGEKLESLRAEAAAARREAEKLGSALAKKRSAAAAKFSKAVVSELRDLGFAKAGFSAEVTPAAPGPEGCDEIRWLFEPNPGEAARTLDAIASSGEAARVVLAVGGALSPSQAAETEVFDEIDANVGGETAFMVGAKLKALSKKRQVVAITHLAQSASFAERHLVAEKTVSGGRTRTSVREASGEERTAELARMLGGGGRGSAAWRHAEEMAAKAGNRV